MDLVWIVPLALVVGIVLGALGGGGAILTVPILVYLLHQSPSAATTGSLVIVVIASLIGLMPRRGTGTVQVKKGLIFGAVGVVGSLIGSFANPLVPAPVLMTMFAALLLVVATLMLRKRARGKRASRDPARPRGLGTLLAAATGVGLLTGFFGVGGGFAVVPALVLVLGLEMPVAVGTSLLVIVVNSLTALAGRAGSGIHLDWPVILTFAVVTSLGTLLGGKVAKKVDSDTLGLAFSILLVAVAAFVAWENVPLLLP